MKHRLALFRSISMNYVAPRTQLKNWDTGEYDDKYTPGNDYVRLTEWLEVDFPDLPADQFVPMQIAALAKEREAVVEKFSAALAAIDGRIANLRAITYQQAQS